MLTTVNVYSVLREGKQWRVTRGRGCTLKLFDNNEEGNRVRCEDGEEVPHRRSSRSIATTVRRRPRRCYVGDPFPLVELSL